MTKIESEVMHILRSRGPISPGDLGWILWGETTESSGRGEGNHGTNKFCRAAGSILRRLEAKGMAGIVQDDRRHMVWIALSEFAGLTVNVDHH